VSKTYHISYDIFGTNLTVSQLQGFLADSRRIKGWYQPFAGSIFVKSDDASGPLREAFRTILGNAVFLISIVDVSTITGALSEEVWRWIYTDDDGFAGLVAKAKQQPSLL
jgi:hypothetical protein